MALKTVGISIDHSGAIVVSGDGMTCFRNKDQLTWVGDATVKEFEIDFATKSPRSPFGSGHKHLPPVPHTPIQAETIDDKQAGQGSIRYDYTVTATRASDGKRIVKDPHIIVNDGSVRSGPIVDPAYFNEVASAALTGVCDVLKQYANDKADDKRFFFPFGIQSIDVDVKLDPLEINVRVAGTTVVS